MQENSTETRKIFILLSDSLAGSDAYFLSDFFQNQIPCLHASGNEEEFKCRSIQISVSVNAVKNMTFSVNA